MKSFFETLRTFAWLVLFTYGIFTIVAVTSSENLSGVRSYD